MVDRSRPEYEALRRALREIRQELGVSQEALAARLGVRQTWVSNYEVGQRRLDLVEVADIAHALGVRIADVIDRAGLEADRSPPLT